MTATPLDKLAECIDALTAEQFIDMMTELDPVEDAGNVQLHLLVKKLRREGWTKEDVISEIEAAIKEKGDLDECLIEKP